MAWEAHSEHRSRATLVPQASCSVSLFSVNMPTFCAYLHETDNGDLGCWDDGHLK